MKKWGCLLVNLGTPKSPSVSDVASYLKEFLLDPEVIDIPWVSRQILVRSLIVPFRAPKSARLYETIWTKEGSPLLVNTVNLQNAIERMLPDLQFAFAFRYGQPSLAESAKALRKQGVENLVVIPLYPQYSTSASRSVENEWRDHKLSGLFKKVVWITDFHDEDFYIESEARMIREKWRPGTHVLFSYHGIPARQITKNHPGCTECHSQGCSLKGDRLCYQRQCQITSRKIADRLGLADSDWSLSYQSRLGRNEWLLPSTEQKLRELLGRGIRDVLVTTPGFSADCLETIEELGEQLHDVFKQGGGNNWTRVQCLNDDPFWVGQISTFIQRKISEAQDGKTPS